MTETAGRQNEVLDAVADSLRAEARGYAARVRLLAELVELSGLEESVSGRPQFPMIELAGSGRFGQGAASARLVEAERMLTTLPKTVQLLEAGELFVHQARVLLAETGSCAPEVARAVEAQLLPAAAELCPADLRKQVKHAVARVESELDAARAESERLGAQRLAEARAERRTWARPVADGMGEAGALLTAEQLRCWSLDLAALERLERVADRQGGVERTADQRRADLFAALPAMVLAARVALADLLQPGPRPSGPSGGTGTAGGGTAGGGTAGGDLAGGDLAGGDLAGGDLAGGDLARLPALLRAGASATPAPAVVNVHVPVATVLDIAREPGTIPGYGPLTAEHVRLLRPVGFRRILVEQATGRPIAVDDRTTPADPDPATARGQVLDMLRPAVVTDAAEPQHDPSARLTRLLEVRDQHCAGPGCSNPHCHRDHHEPYPAGPTAAWNVGLLSDRCHQAKHNGWTMVRHPDGSTTWTSPLARTYRRPSPHRPPPTTDPDAELPPLRPPPTAPAPWWAGKAAGDPAEAPDNDPPDAPPALLDDPPF